MLAARSAPQRQLALHTPLEDSRLTDSRSATKPDMGKPEPAQSNRHSIRTREIRPSPAISDGSGPRVISPTVVGGSVINRRNVAVIGISAIVISAIGICV